MGKGPGGKRRPQRDRRPGRAGIGPGPAYRPTKTGKGTKHTPGSKTNGGMCRFGRLVGAVILAFIAASVAATIGAAVLA